MFPRENAKLPGNWADVRLSWGTEPAGSQSLIQELLILAKKVGAVLYDGQIKKVITQDNIPDAVASLTRGGTWVKKALGFANPPE